MVKYSDLKDGNINASHQRPTKRVAVCWQDCMRLLGFYSCFQKLYSYL